MFVYVPLKLEYKKFFSLFRVFPYIYFGFNKICRNVFLFVIFFISYLLMSVKEINARQVKMKIYIN